MVSRCDILLTGEELCLVDTPGLSDAVDSPESVERALGEIARGLQLASKDKDGGVDAILYVLSAASRFTAAEKFVLEYFQDMGRNPKEFWSYVIVVFTNADRIPGDDEAQQDFIFQTVANPQCPPEFKWLMLTVGKRFVMVESVNKRSDYIYRNRKIHEIVNHLYGIREINQGRRYTNQLFQRIHHRYAGVTKRERELHGLIQEKTLELDAAEKRKQDVETQLDAAEKRKQEVERQLNQWKKDAYQEHEQHLVDHKKIVSQKDRLKSELDEAHRKTVVAKTELDEVQKEAEENLGQILMANEQTQQELRGEIERLSQVRHDNIVLGSSLLCSIPSFRTCTIPQVHILISSMTEKMFPRRLQRCHQRRAKDLHQGDKVLCQSTKGDLVYSSIVAFLHYEPDRYVKYLAIETTQGNTLNVSESHLIYSTTEADSKLCPKFARLVKEGDFIGSVSTDLKQLVISQVKSITTAWKQGVYAPLTRTGTIVVDGALASCYASFNNHTAANIAFAPLRFLTRRKQLQQLPQEGIHKYASLLYKVVNCVYPQGFADFD